MLTVAVCGAHAQLAESRFLETQDDRQPSCGGSQWSHTHAPILSASAEDVKSES